MRRTASPSLGGWLAMIVATHAVSCGSQAPPTKNADTGPGTDASGVAQGEAGSGSHSTDASPPATPEGGADATSADATSAACPFAVTAAAHGISSDGCMEAPAGTPQYPSLLSGYGSNRPGWDVAGVDYYVGIPDGTTLTDWQSITDPNVTVSAGSGIVRCTGAGASVTLDKIDFSMHGGAYIYNGSSGCANITITNSNFACPSEAPSFTFIHDQNGATYTIKYNKFNGANCGSPQLSTLISAGAPITLEYNWFINSPQQVLDAGGNGSIDYHFNLLDNMTIGPGQHMNYLQFGGTGNSTPRVTFNTGYQTSLGGAEGFQFYSNNLPYTLTSPVFQYNTLMAKPSGGNNTMSYMIHGNCHSMADCSTTMTTIAGTAINSDNYFDPTGAYGAYYTGTMTPSMGWTSSGNIDMTTGAPIIPH